MRTTNSRNLVQEYLSLLDSQSREQVYQRYMEDNTQLVPREFVLNHGIWAQIILRKLPLGSSYKSGFAFVTKSSLQWRCVFIEIKRPDKKFFRDSSTDFHADFQRPIQQIGRWRAWFKGKEHERACEVLHPLLSFPQVEDPVDIKFILVYGRRAEFQSTKIRRALIDSQQREDFRIMSFDSLVEDLPSKEPLYLGVRRNAYVDICSDAFLSDTPFCALEPENICVTQSLLDAATAALTAESVLRSPPHSSPIKRTCRRSYTEYSVSALDLQHRLNARLLKASQ